MAAKERKIGTKKIVLLVLVSGFFMTVLGLAVWLPGAFERAASVRVAREAVDVLFEDERQVSLARFNSDSTAFAERLFSDAEEAVALVEDNQRQAEFTDLIARARGYWDIQLYAHALVEALFCDYDDGCPDTAGHVCYPRVANTADDFSLAREAVEEITTVIVRIEKTDRIDMARAEYNLVSSIQNNLAELEEGSVTEAALNDLSRKVEGLISSFARTVFDTAIQELMEGLSTAGEVQQDPRQAQEQRQSQDASYSVSGYGRGSEDSGSGSGGGVASSGRGALRGGGSGTAGGMTGPGMIGRGTGSGDASSDVPPAGDSAPGSGMGGTPTQPPTQSPTRPPTQPPGHPPSSAAPPSAPATCSCNAGAVPGLSACGTISGSACPECGLFTAW